MGTSTLVSKLLQHIAVIRKAVLYEIFLDLHKAYGALAQGGALTFLEGYVVGHQVFRILTRYWERATIEERDIGYYRDP